MSKLITFEYNREYEPPAPFIEIQVDGYDPSRPPVMLEAFVDSGADGTMLPRRILTQIRAEFEDTVMLRGTAGGRRRTDRYTIRITIGEFVIHAVSAVAMPNNSEPIIGRDVLNELAVKLNGPATTTEVQLD